MIWIPKFKPIFRSKKMLRKMTKKVILRSTQKILDL